MNTQDPNQPGDTATDVLGHPLTADEAEVRAIYERLDALANQGDLAPCTRANINTARALLWNACNDLGLL